MQEKLGDTSVTSCQADMAAYQILKPLFLADLPLPWEARVAAAALSIDAAAVTFRRYNEGITGDMTSTILGPRRWFSEWRK